VRDEAERKADSEAVEVGARRCRDAEGVTVGEAVAEAERLLAARQIDTARLDAELLIEKALGVTRLELYLEPKRELSADELAAFGALVERRSRHEPAAYILGEWGFRGLTLAVDPRVLIPRPGTEVVVEHCLVYLQSLPEPHVLDVGTGSGAIALAIADEHPSARVTAIDTSADALAVAAENLERTGLGDRVTLLQRDLAEPLGGPYDLIVANPPYVAEDELPMLQPEVRDWEPRLALVDRGQTEVIVEAAREALRPGGLLVVEVGDGRGADVGRLLGGLGYTEVSASPDLSGRDRVVEGRWGTSSRR
jgi:release factor glutamine methyltransferase